MVRDFSVTGGATYQVFSPGGGQPPFVLEILPVSVVWLCRSFPLGLRVLPGTGNTASFQYSLICFQQWRWVVFHYVAACAGATIFSNHVGRHWLRHRWNISAAHSTGANPSEL